MDAHLNSDLRTLQPRSIGDVRELIADRLSSRIQFGTFSISAPGCPGVDCAIGYRRWVEFDSVNGAGQDAALLRSDGEYVIGVVADGVSQSFFGDIAAWKVMGLLSELLWNTRRHPIPATQMEEELKHFQRVVDHEFVRNRSLPESLFELQRDALEATRSSGSQTVFSGFVLETATRRATLYQVGDVEAVLVVADREQLVFRADSAGRWSSAGQSEMRLDRREIDDVSSILLRSDGVGTRWASIADGIYDLERFAHLARDRAEKDDLSYVSARLWDRESGSVLSGKRAESAAVPRRIAKPERRRSRDTQSAHRIAGEGEKRLARSEVATPQCATAAATETPDGKRPLEATLGIALLAWIIVGSFLLGFFTGLLLMCGNRNLDNRVEFQWRRGEIHGPPSAHRSQRPGTAQRN